MTTTVNPIWDSVPQWYKDMYGNNGEANYQYFINRNTTFDLFGLDSRAKAQNEAATQRALMGVQRDMDEAWYQSHESFQARFNEMVAAGVDPNTAIKALAGQGAGASPGNTPVPAANPQTRSVDSLANAASAVGSISEQASMIRLNNANSKKLDAETKRYNDVVDAEILQRIGSFAKDLTNAGMPEIEAMLFAFKNVRKGLDGIESFLEGENVCRYIDTQREAIEAEYSKKMKEVEVMESELELMDWSIEREKHEAKIAEIRESREEIAKWRDEEEKKMWQLFESSPYYEEWRYQEAIRLKYGADSPQYKACLAGVTGRVYANQKGIENAKIDTIFDQVYNSTLAANKVNSAYAPSAARIEALKAAVIEYSRFLLDNGHGVSGIESALGKLLNAVLIPTFKGEFGVDEILRSDSVDLIPKSSSLHNLRESLK